MAMDLRKGGFERDRISLNWFGELFGASRNPLFDDSHFLGGRARKLWPVSWWHPTAIHDVVQLGTFGVLGGDYAAID